MSNKEKARPVSRATVKESGKVDLHKGTYFSNIPDELKELNHWVLWRKETTSKGKPTKIPYQSNGRRADATKPETWSDFNTVENASNKGSFSGIGFVFTADCGLTGIDIDAKKDGSHKLISNGQIVDEEVQAIVDSVNSYTEITQSGNGIHIIVIGSKPGKRCKKSHKNFDVEIYDKNRYFVMTGNVVKSYETLTSNQPAINDFYSKYLESNPVDDIHSQIAKDKKLNDLLQGRSNGYGSESERDLAVCGMLTKYTKDYTTIDQIIRQSPIFRPKWDEKRGLESYGAITIQKALQGQKQGAKQTNPDELNKYIRVGDNYYKFVQLPNGTEQMQRFSRQTIIDDYGKAVINQIKKYDSFVNVPNNIDYKAEINNCLNLYSKPLHTPKKGEYETILNLIKHIFGKQYDYGLDYIQLLYTRPTQMLPVLALVSKENGTGKTTFAELLTYIFGANATIIGIPEFSSDFNNVYASKLVTCIEEGKLHDGKIVNKLKAQSTANTIQLRKMHREHETINFYGKFIILSNHETNFLNLENNDIRYWVRLIPKISFFDADYKTKLKKEVPAFLYFLNNREIKAKNQSRMWFSPEIIQTDQLQKAKRESWSSVTKDIINWCMETMEAEDLQRIDANLTDLWEKVFYGSGRVTRSEIKSCLANELEMKPAGFKSRYDFLGFSKTGTFYTFVYDKIKNLV